MLRPMTAQPDARAPFAGVNATWNYTLGSIVFLFLVLDLLVITDLLVRYLNSESGLLLALIVACIAASATRIRYCWFLRGEGEDGMPRLAWTVALFLPALAAWALAFVLPEAAVFAAAQLWFSGVLFSIVVQRKLRWQVMFAALVATLIPIATRLLSGREALDLAERNAAPFVVIYGVLLPLMLISSLWLWRIVRRLDEARHLAAELAVTQERLRFAADLHDVQGHHLQVIALKAELVERTLAAKPDYAAEQVGEIRVIAKEALEETRSLVAGLREVELGDELENAREVLTLSGAECALEVSETPASVEARRVLGFAVREATTNILRHSEATSATISLGPARGGFELVVVNDGIATGPGGAPDAGPDGRSGSGLAGLRARVSVLGGTLSAMPVRTSFELRLWLPEGGSQ